MRSTLAIVGSFALVAATAATEIQRRSVSMPSHVSWLDTAVATEPIHLQLVLKMKSSDIEGQLRKYSDPDSGCYGNWMTRDEVFDTFGPDQDAIDNAVKWLIGEDIQQVDVQGWNVDFMTTIEQADRLFDAEFAWYEVRGMRKLRTLSYAIPAELEKYVDLLTPTTYFGPPWSPEPNIIPLELQSRNEEASHEDQTPDARNYKHRRRQPFARRAQSNSSTCENTITPDCLDQLHDYSWYAPPANTTSRIGFASFLNISAHVQSYQRFVNAFGLDAKGFDSVLVNGGVSNQSLRASSGEADLDVQMMSAVAPALQITEYIVGGVP